eukprot:TRINITY_DN20938_c0_g1_i1.p1 TRINITY_DN20938_c0_g1~~TRINITY_DN20938_c0_g1_i1.p1  ORF type:complete len:222 (+),score=28.91 TRINITY_DN20938_c0_g1_i1:84-668(+)
MPPAAAAEGQLPPSAHPGPRAGAAGPDATVYSGVIQTASAKKNSTGAHVFWLIRSEGYAEKYERITGPHCFLYGSRAPREAKIGAQVEFRVGHIFGKVQAQACWLVGPSRPAGAAGACEDRGGRVNARPASVRPERHRSRDSSRDVRRDRASRPVVNGRDAAQAPPLFSICCGDPFVQGYPARYCMQCGRCVSS